MKKINVRINTQDLQNHLFDFIGDVHGCYQKLCSLLEKMGYQKDKDGHYCHPERKAFFLGDIIDGGDEVEKCFYLVKNMVEKGYAFCIMGNHEINLIAINTKSKVDGRYLRERSNSKLRQCKKSLDLIIGTDEKENIKFLMSLPLFVETKDFRAIHACWYHESLQIIKPLLDENNCLNEENFRFIYENRDSNEYDALEKLLKGLEIDLPADLAFSDSYGNHRDKCRFNWWDKNRNVEKRIKVDLETNLPKYDDKIPVFFGHYWMQGSPYLTSDYAICLDFSAVKGGELCSYRFNGTIRKDDLVYI